MKRTTIMLDEGLLINARYLATRQGKTLTRLVQDALEAYVQSHWLPLELEFAGAGNSGDGTIGGRDEEILAAEIDPISGWSPERRSTTAPASASSADPQGWRSCRS